MNEKQFERMTRTVADKIKSAEGYHLGDRFEVASWYREGRFSLDADAVKADEYIASVLEKLSSARPYFQSINLINFKGVRSVRGRIELDPYLNVFVGVNGSGKTTILDALSKVSSWIVSGIRNHQANGKPLDSSEINHHSSAKSAAIIASLVLDENSTFYIELCKNRSHTSKVRSSLAEFKNLAEMYYYFMNAGGGGALPLFSYYSVSRALEVKVEDTRKEDDITVFNMLDGYNESFDETKNFKNLLRWMTFLSAQNNDSPESFDGVYFALKTANNSLREVYDNLPDFGMENSDFVKDLLTKIEYNEKMLFDLESRRSSNDHKAVKIVKDAIYRFMEIENIRMNVTSDSVTILMEKNGVTISATDLSQGEKALFSLVSDISRRLVLLNPCDPNNALNGFGVVMIDEIDLHLHPKWQQEIVSKLREVFPNIQFILTTHSPQVLSTVPHSCIKVVNNDDNGCVSVFEPDFSLGSESKMILEDIFQVDSRPKNIEIVKILDEYSKLVIQDKWDSEEAYRLREKLEAWGAGRDPIINKLQMDVRLRKHRRGN